MGVAARDAPVLEVIPTGHYNLGRSGNDSRLDAAELKRETPGSSQALKQQLMVKLHP